MVKEGSKRTWIAITLVVIVALGAYCLQPGLAYSEQVNNGYGSKLGCSIVFVSGRTIQSAIEAEFTFPPIRFLSYFEVDEEARCVTARSRIGQGHQTACYRGRRYGCSRVREGLSPAFPSLPEPPAQLTRPQLFPWGDAQNHQAVAAARSSIDLDAIDRAVEAHFEDSRLHARAFVLIKDGQVVYERYGDNATAETPLLGWSMTKSWINALVGIRIAQGGIPGGLAARVGDLLPEFEHDARGNLTLSALMRMSDGLDFDEFYTPGADAPHMLFVQDSLLLPERKLRPGAEGCFQYSSHTTNIISRLLRNSFDSHAEYMRFPTESFFHRLGMQSAVLETDPSGVFVGSSFGWASARDWARFGLLYLQDGCWPSTPPGARVQTASGEEERVLPPGWVDFSREPTSSSSGHYGAQFWLGGGVSKDAPARVAQCDRVFPSRLDPPRAWLGQAFPPNSMVAHGFEEQSVSIMPDQNAVMVRLGATKELVLRWDRVGFYKQITDALK